MKTKCCGSKFIFAIIAFAVISFGSGFLWHIFESVWNTDQLRPIWRPMGSPEWKMMPLYNIILAIIFVSLYCCLGSALSCCKCPFMRGAMFGFKVWLIAALPNCIMWYISENITIQVIILALSVQFISFVLGGAIASKILGNKWDCDTSEACNSGTEKSCGTEKPAGSCHTEKNHCGSGKNHCGSKE